MEMTAAPTLDASWQGALYAHPDLYVRLDVAKLLRDEELRALVAPMQSAAFGRTDGSLVVLPVIERCDELVASLCAPFGELRASR